MSSIVVSGDTSGAVTLAAPLVAGTNTATLPLATGELSMLGGAGQTWTNVLVTPGRALSTTYTNSTGKPIYVAVQIAVSTTTTVTAIVGGVTIANYAVATAGMSGSMFYFIVPNGIGYSVTSSATALFSWSELR